MERKFYPENFEYFLKGHADNFRMTPSKKVWHGIYNDLYPGRRWPSIAMSMVFIFTLVVIGHLNTTNSHNTPLSNVAYTNNLATFSSTKQKTKSTPVNRTLTYINTDTDIAAVNIIEAEHENQINTLTPVTVQNNNIITKNSPLVEATNTLVNATSYPTESNNSDETNNNITVEKNTSIKEKKVTDPDNFSSEALLSITKTKKNKAEWTYYLAPTLSYRNFRDNPNQINNSVNQKPMIGLEAGAVMSFKISKQLQALSGFQLNYSGYNIRANHTHPILSTLMVNTNVPGFKEPYTTISLYGNRTGNSNAKLKNYSIYASIPLGLQYTFGVNDNIKLNAEATFQPSVLITGNAQLLSTDRKNYLNGESMSRKWNMSTNFGTFVSFKTSSYNWKIGPQINYQLLSTYTGRSPYNEHFINYGIRFGISKNQK